MGNALNQNQWTDIKVNALFGFQRTTEAINTEHTKSELSLPALLHMPG